MTPWKSPITIIQQVQVCGSEANSTYPDTHHPLQHSLISARQPVGHKRQLFCCMTLQLQRFRHIRCIQPLFPFNVSTSTTQDFGRYSTALQFKRFIQDVLGMIPVQSLTLSHFIWRYLGSACKSGNRSTFRQMMLSGMTPSVPSVAESSVRLFPSMERFWSNGATEKACMIYSVTRTENHNVCSQQNNRGSTEYPVSAHLYFQLLKSLIGWNDECFLSSQFPVPSASPDST